LDENGALADIDFPAGCAHSFGPPLFSEANVMVDHHAEIPRIDSAFESGGLRQ
jgi:hypothetical protein